MDSTRPQKSTVNGIDILTVLRPQATKTVVLLHGYGANYEDLASLAPIIDRERKWNWIFPNGIQPVPMGAYGSARAWFPLRMAEIEAAAMRGETVDFTSVCPNGMKEAEERLVSLINSLRLDSADLVLGGFSQGAMMTVQLAINLKTKPRGLLLFSGALINRNEWIDKLPRLAGVPVFQSHGAGDQILGFEYAERLRQLFVDANVPVEWVPFQGGHEIPLQVIQKATAFLQLR